VIHFWHAWGGEEGQVIRDIVDDFNLSNPWSIVVVPVVQGNLDELYANLDTALKEGDPPDLVTAYLYQALRWEAAEALVDLQDYVADPVWGFKPEEQADFYPVFWNQDLIRDKRLGIPAQMSGQLLYYNRTWAQKLGYGAPPAKPEHFEQQACAAAKANREDEDPSNDNTGGWIIAGQDRPDYSAMLAWIYAFGGKIVQTPDEIASQPTQTEIRSPYQFDTPEVEAAFTYLRGLYDDGCAWFSSDPYSDAEFATRQGLFATGSVMDLPFVTKAFQNAGNGDNWTVIPFPSPELHPTIDVYGPSFQVLASSSRRQLAAWVFIKWMVSPENQARWVQVSSAYPLRRSELDLLDTYQRHNLQWGEAVKFLEYAQGEPPLASWDTVRWALGDAGTQLFRSYFTIDQVPNLALLLDRTAAELHLGPNLEEVFATPEPGTLTPSP
jgi:ABC-type glycerol-3-phosphate transport system substrate-binding protein